MRENVIASSIVFLRSLEVLRDLGDYLCLQRVVYQFPSGGLAADLIEIIHLDSFLVVKHGLTSSILAETFFIVLIICVLAERLVHLIDSCDWFVQDRGSLLPGCRIT